MSTQTFHDRNAPSCPPSPPPRTPPPPTLPPPPPPAGQRDRQTFLFYIYGCVICHVEYHTIHNDRYMIEAFTDTK